VESHAKRQTIAQQKRRISLSKKLSLKSSSVAVEDDESAAAATPDRGARERRNTRDVEQAAVAAASLLGASHMLSSEASFMVASEAPDRQSSSSTESRGSGGGRNSFLVTTRNSVRAISFASNDAAVPAAGATDTVGTSTSADASAAPVHGSGHGSLPGSGSTHAAMHSRHQSTGTLLSRFTLRGKSHPNRKDKQAALVFFNVVKMLLAPPLRTAILIEDAHLCDELSWIELSRWSEMVSHTAVMLTMVTKPPPPSQQAELQRRPSQAYVPFMGTDGDDRGAVIERCGVVVSDASRPVLFHPDTVIVEMVGLTAAEVKELLERYFASGAAGASGNDGAAIVVSDELAQAVHSAAAGSPFWCATIAKFMKERGVEEFQRSMESDKRGLNFIVLTRMEKLSLECQMVAKCASIIGSEFTVSLLASVLPNRMGADVDKVRENCSDIVGIGFFYCTDSTNANDPTFSFRNDFIAKALVELTPPSEASRIHLLTAKYIETEYADLRSHYESLIGHYEASNHQEKRPTVFRYACEAAEYKIQGESYAQGLRYCHTALACTENAVELRRLADIVARGHEDLATKVAPGGGADGAAAGNPRRISGAEADSLLTQYTQLIRQLEEKAREVLANNHDASNGGNDKKLASRGGCVVS
jgi:hypothetical protein